MDAEAILARAKERGESPQGWIVFPLLQRKVALGILGWLFGAALGLGFFAAIFPVVVPYNYQHSIIGALFTSLLLGVLLFIGLGSLWALFVDARRLSRARDHLIVLTAEDFVKQEGSVIFHVPLVHVRSVTVRGRAKPDRTAPKGSVNAELAPTGQNMVGFLFGRGITQTPGQRRQSMRTPTSLAFVDGRSDHEVVVVNDSAYGDPYLIAALLKKYAGNVQNNLVR
jgi:hypothetical protein